MTTHFYGIDPWMFALFQGLDEEAVAHFFSLGFQMDLKAGTSLVSHKDEGDRFYLTLHGMSKLLLVNPQYPDPIHLTIFCTGDFFGETALLDPEVTRRANIAAITDMGVFVVPKQEFLYLVHTYPAFMVNIARVVGQRLTMMNERLMVERWREHTRKVAHTLVFFSDKGKCFNEAGTILLPPLPLKEWAKFCYTMREEFMMSMEQLKQAGAVQWQNQRIAITDMQMLRRFADIHLVPD